MIAETKRNREWQFAPLVIPKLGAWRQGTKFDLRPSEAHWTFFNKGLGAAIRVRAAEVGAESGEAATVAFIEPNGEEPAAGWLAHEVAYDGTIQKEQAPLHLRVTYEDVFGNRYETIWNKGNYGFRRLELEEEPRGLAQA